MAVVRELITRFGFNVDQTGMNRVEGSINRLSGMLSGLAAFASIRALARVADSMQSLEARIGMLPQTIGDAGDAFDEVARRASLARQGIQTYGTLYVRLAGATKEYLTTQEDVLLVTDSISKALVIGGAVATEQASALLQISQAFQKGKLDGDEFKSFMENLSTDFKEKLAVQLETTIDKLYDLSSSGQLTAKKLALAFKAMAPEIERQMLRMPLTISQGTEIAFNKFRRMIARINRESQIVTNIANAIINSGKSLESFFSSFIDFVGGSTNAVKAFGIALIALLSPLALGGFIKLIAMLLSPAGLLAGIVILLGLAIDDVVTYLDGGESIFGDFVKWLSDGSLGAATLKGALVALTASLSLYIVYLGTLAKAWLIAQLAALRGAQKMAIAWLIALGPVGLIIAAIAAISTALFFLWDNWDKVTGWMGDKVTWLIDKLKSLGQYLPDFSGGNISVNSAAISPASMAGAGGVNNVTSNQVVNLTVPPGTPESQQAFLQNAAGVLKGESPEKKMARDMSGGGW